MSRTGRRRRGPPRCTSCGAPFVWIRAPGTGNWCPFDPSPVDRRGLQTRVAYPVEAERAWYPRDLIEDLMIRRHITEAEAAVEVDDMPWHTIHDCSLSPHHPDQDDAP